MAIDPCSCDCIPANMDAMAFYQRAMYQLCNIAENTAGGGGDVNLTEVGGVAVALGQALAAASIPVVLASDQTWAGALTLGKAEDAVAASGDVGIALLTVQTATPASTAADGDYGWLKTDALGKLWTADTKVEDVAHVTGDIGSFVLGVNNFNQTITFNGVAGDYTPMAVTPTGATMAMITYDDNVSENISAVKREDAAATNGAALVAVASVQTQTPASTAADGDYVWLKSDPLGKLWVTGSYKEDTLHIADDVGNFVLAVRRNDPVSSTAVDGEYAAMNTNATGGLYVDPANHVATWAAATISGAAGGITTGGANALTNSAKMKRVQLLNTSDQIVQLSLDAGTTWVMSAIALTGIAVFDLAANGAYSVSNISVRSLGSNTTAGSAYISVMI